VAERQRGGQQHELDRRGTSGPRAGAGREPARSGPRRTDRQEPRAAAGRGVRRDGRAAIVLRRATASAEPVEWQPAPEAGPSAPAFRFIGSIEENGSIRALVSDGYAVRALGGGEEVDGWTVVAIDGRRLVLAHGDERLELTILQ
jgi:hypothetical protein